PVETDTGIDRPTDESAVLASVQKQVSRFRPAFRTVVYRADRCGRQVDHAIDRRAVPQHERASDISLIESQGKSFRVRERGRLAIDIAAEAGADKPGFPDNGRAAQRQV